MWVNKISNLKLFKMICLLKKGLFVVLYLMVKIEKMEVSGKKDVIKIWLCVLIIFLIMIGYMFVVYNG